MRMSYGKKTILAALGILLLAGMSAARTSAADRPLLIMADLSGSSQKKLSYLNPPQNTPVQITRAAAIKEILTLFARGLPPDGCSLGLFEVRYLSGDDNGYAPVIPVATCRAADLEKQIGESLVTETPVFNRRTPLSDSLRQLDEKSLKALEGKAVILLISDGEENIRAAAGNADDGQASTTGEAVKDPLSEVRRLKLAYGDKLVFHAIGLEEDNPGAQNGQDPEGLALLRKMAAAGGGQYFSARELLQDRKAVADLCPLLCGTAGLLPE